jgi:hypothetical protein
MITPDFMWKVEEIVDEHKNIARIIFKSHTRKATKLRLLNKLYLKILNKKHNEVLK